jgi:uracil-DNA glycosylase
MAAISGDWLEALRPEFSKPYYRDLFSFVQDEYRTYTVYPPAQDLFNALHETPLGSVRVVILGQDLYHGEGQAHGMCFSVRPGCPAPPSLVNIFKEMRADLGITPPSHGNLESWAREGVLLLNAVLTVREHEANSHKGKGWEQFTDKVISLLNEREDPVVFILWGANAKAKAALVTNDRHCIITGAHPSPLSAHNGFWGGRYFSKTNEFLEEKGYEPINWRIAE